MPSIAAENWLLAYDSVGDTVAAFVNVLPGSKIVEPVSALELCEFEVVKDTNSALLTIGREVGFWRQHEGEIFRGKVFRRERSQKDGRSTWKISSACLGIELQKQTTWMGIIARDLSASATASAILAESNTTWSAALTGSGFVNISERYDNESLLDAFKRFSEQQNAFYRFSKTTTRQIEVVRTAASTGMLLTNVDNFDQGDRKIGILRSLKEETEGDVINRIVPLGLKAGNIIFDLSLSDINTPYTRNSVIKNSPSVVDFSFDETGSVGHRTIKVFSTGKNRFLLFGFAASTLDANVDGGTNAPRANGKFLTFLSDEAVGSKTMQLYYLVGPDDGIIEVEYNSDTLSTNYLAWAVVFQDVDQFDPIRAFGSASNTNTTPSVSVASAIGDAVFDFVMRESSATSTPGTNQEEIFEQGATGFTMRVNLSRELATGASTTMSQTLSASVAWSTTAFSLKPAMAWYIEDATSQTDYGLSEWVMVEPASKRPGATDADLIDAANTLYQLAATRLDRLKNPPMERKWEVAYLPLGPRDWKVGDTLDIEWRNNGESISENDQYCASRTQVFDDAGVRHWELIMSDRPTVPKMLEDYLADALQKIAAIETNSV